MWRLITISFFMMLIENLSAISASKSSKTNSRGGKLSNKMPKIENEIMNVTAAEGKTATFTCIVKNLNKYHVVWFHVERNMLLTIHTKIVTRINRFRVIEDDNTKWTLQIRDVTPEDKGAYACQVNTEPQLRKIGYLDVVVSPEIDDERSSPSTVIVKENENVTLLCHAVGNPQPNISWVREDQGPISIQQRHKVFRHEGATLDLKKVSRTDMGAYLCIASNGYPPSVSKRTELFVEFSPIVIIPNQLMAAPVNTTVTLECVTEAYPRAVTYWKFKGHMIMSNSKYRIHENHKNYRTSVFLTIDDLKEEDFGTYLCNSRNSFGENLGVVELNQMAKIERKNIEKTKTEKKERRDKSKNKNADSKKNQIFKRTNLTHNSNSMDKTAVGTAGFEPTFLEEFPQNPTSNKNGFLPDISGTESQSGGRWKKNVLGLLAMTLIQLYDSDSVAMTLIQFCLV